MAKKLTGKESPNKILYLVKDLPKEHPDIADLDNQNLDQLKFDMAMAKNCQNNASKH